MDETKYYRILVRKDEKFLGFRNVPHSSSPSYPTVKSLLPLTDGPLLPLLLQVTPETSILVRISTVRLYFLLNPWKFPVLPFIPLLLHSRFTVELPLEFLVKFLSFGKGSLVRSYMLFAMKWGRSREFSCAACVCFPETAF